MILRVCERRAIELTTDELREIEAGRFRLLRVDINQSFAAGSRVEAERWIKRAAVATLKHRGRGQQPGPTTVIWGERSRCWSLKAYAKGTELEARRHQLPSTVPMRTKLLSWADDKVRIELMLRSRELKKLGLDCAASWAAGTALQLFREYLSRLQLGSVSFTPSILELIPQHLRLTHLLWSEGKDLKELFSKSKRHRHRQKLLEYGIDIGAPHQADVAMDTPLARYLELPAETPDWATGELGKEIRSGLPVSGWNKNPVLLSDASPPGAP
jgi:II/X family phage/plasmid replication protein